MAVNDSLEHTGDVNALLARYGVKFDIYKNNTFKEQLFPFDTIPRVIEHEEFAYLEKGLLTWIDEFIGAKCSIPDTVKTMIGCFEGCIAMTEAPDLTDASSLVNMTDCFNRCSSLQKVGALPENIKIADRAFMNVLP